MQVWRVIPQFPQIASHISLVKLVILSQSDGPVPNVVGIFSRQGRTPSAHVLVLRGTSALTELGTSSAPRQSLGPAKHGRLEVFLVIVLCVQCRESTAARSPLPLAASPLNSQHRRMHRRVLSHRHRIVLGCILQIFMTLEELLLQLGPLLTFIFHLSIHSQLEESTEHVVGVLFPDHFLKSFEQLFALLLSMQYLFHLKID